jgi:hypothetical protein
MLVVANVVAMMSVVMYVRIRFECRLTVLLGRPSHLPHPAGDTWIRTASGLKFLRLLEPAYFVLRLCKVHTKILILRLESRILLFKSRHLRFRLRQTLLEYRGEWNFFQYVSDYAHNVLMIQPNLKQCIRHAGRQQAPKSS